MPVTIQWVCDRDNVSAQGDSAMPPTGWARLSCTLTNEQGGVQPSSLELCPACVAAMGEWLGKPVFEIAVGTPVVPLETNVPATDPGEPAPVPTPTTEGASP